MCSSLAIGVKKEYILTILEQCSKYPENTYLFQTKNTNRVYEFATYKNRFPPDTIISTTIESNRWHESMNNCPNPYERAEGMSRLTMFNRMVTIEPIMTFDLNDMITLLEMCKPYQVNIGANSYSKVQLEEPTKKEIIDLLNKIYEIKSVSFVVQKENLKRLL